MMNCPDLIQQPQKKDAYTIASGLSEKMTAKSRKK